MRSSVEVLERDVAEMKALADSIRPASDLLAVHGDSRIKAYLSIRRRFDYSALIVALYASFEQFVEDILRSYVTSLAKSQSYGNLPPKLTAKHLRKSAEFLARGEINLERHPGFTSIQIVENLLSCLKGSAEYQLNSIARIRRLYRSSCTLYSYTAGFGVPSTRRKQKEFRIFIASEGPV